MSDRKFVPKVWGYEDWIVNNAKYCGKVLFFKKGKSCSLHYHKLKEETFYIQSGKLEVFYYQDRGIDKLILEKHAGLFMLQGLTNGIHQTILEAGDSFHVPIGMRHRMTGLLDTVMFEFSTHHEDSDSYRIIPS